MRLLEHQGKRLLAGFGLNLNAGTVAAAADAAREAAAEIGGPVVVKAQVPFGGRGKAGAVKVANDPGAAWTAAAELLGTTLRGHRIAAVSVEPRVSIRREFYVGAAWDCAAKLPVAILAAAGGIEVESSRNVARRSFDPRGPLPASAGAEMVDGLGIDARVAAELGRVLEKVTRALVECDAITVEINPLAETTDGILIGLDARVEIDDDAAARQQVRLAPLGAISQGSLGRPATPLEAEAARIDALDHRGVAGRVVEFGGDLALLIGGGGASLTVFDAIQRHGGNPANYCEVGGNPTEEKVAALTALLLGKPGVRKLAVIMNVVNNTRADVMARGVLLGLDRAGRTAAGTIAVFRIPGSWEDEARAIMAAAGIRALGREVSLDEAARLAVTHAA